MHVEDRPGPEFLPEMLTLVEAMPDPRAFLGADYKVLAVNKAYREQFGDPREDRHRFCYEMSHHLSVPCDQAGENCPLLTSRETGEPFRTLHIHQTPNGPEHVDVEVCPIRDGQGKILFYMETMRTVRRAHSRPSVRGLVGRSAVFNRMLDLIERVGPSDATVLLLGESGTGKELAAMALHEASAHGNGRFVAMDCAGMTESLFGSELFGYEKGAFTGATHRKIGLVEAAAGGTLFFDEIGDMPLSLQVKLLRLLESGTFRRVGGLEQIRADFRLVLATHRDLKAMVEEGTFRRDLYYRISAFPIVVPALRDRREDIPLLVESLMSRVCGRRRCLHPEAMARLIAHDFPGNIRELRNILERACLLADGERVMAQHLPEDLSASPLQLTEIVELPKAPESILPLAEAERRYLKWALERHGTDRRGLADRLGISERTLYRKIAELEV